MCKVFTLHFSTVFITWMRAVSMLLCSHCSVSEPLQVLTISSFHAWITSGDNGKPDELVRSVPLTSLRMSRLQVQWCTLEGFERTSMASLRRTDGFSKEK
jgi:hypothetical protein